MKDIFTEFALNTEDPLTNFNLGLKYHELGHWASAASHYLRCAERTEDLDFAYECLIKCYYCFKSMQNRNFTAIHFLKHAITVLPKRPEAYFILSRFSESRQSWQDCYIYADWGIQFANFNLKPLLTDVEYPGYCGLLFEKAISGWWWGKNEESKNILLDLKRFAFSLNSINLLLFINSSFFAPFPITTFLYCKSLIKYNPTPCILSVFRKSVILPKNP
jgi:tetratricopeptide (TPR) repeat protein